MDLKKEIKLSDLFKRGEKEAKAEKKEPRERKLSFQRRRKESDAASAPTPPTKAPKVPRAKGKAAKAPALPAIPLMRAFNLLPKDDPRDGKERNPNLGRVLLAVVGLVLVAALGAMFLLTSARVSEKQQKRDELRSKTAALNVPAKPPANAADQELVQERDSRTGALASALGGRVAWDRLLREISLVLPEDVWLTKLQATGATAAASAGAPPPQSGTAPTSSVTITGYTYDQATVAQLLSRVSVIPQLSTVKLLSSTRTKIGEKEVFEFSISAAVKPTTGASA